MVWLDIVVVLSIEKTFSWYEKTLFSKHPIWTTFQELRYLCAKKKTVHTITVRVNQSFWKSLGIPNYYW